MGYMKRKILLINPNFQLRFIGWAIALSIGLNLIYFSSHLLFFKYYFIKGEQAGLSHDHVFFKFLHDQYTVVKWIFVGISALAILVISIWGLVLSNRIAGPIHRVCNFLKQARFEGTSKPLKLRENDYFKKELESAINKRD